MELPTHPGTEDRPDYAPAPGSNWGTKVVFVVLAALVALIVLLHLLGAVGPRAHG